MLHTCQLFFSEIKQTSLARGVPLASGSPNANSYYLLSSCAMPRTELGDLRTLLLPVLSMTLLNGGWNQVLGYKLSEIPKGYRSVRSSPPGGRVLKQVLQPA